MNIDEKEINNFDSFAHEWWNKRGPYKLIHNLTPLRLDYIQQHMNIKNSNILDIGCGGGILAEELTDKGAKVTGLDVSKKTIQIAKSHAKEKNHSIISYLTFLYTLGSITVIKNVRFAPPIIAPGSQDYAFPRPWADPENTKISKNHSFIPYLSFSYT